jgi:hypothetical protein
MVLEVAVHRDATPLTKSSVAQSLTPDFPYPGLLAEPAA